MRQPTRQQLQRPVLEVGEEGVSEHMREWCDMLWVVCWQAREEGRRTQGGEASLRFTLEFSLGTGGGPFFNGVGG